MLISDNNLEIIVTDWTLAEDLFIKWGYDATGTQIVVRDIKEVTPELNAWGIPWKYC